MLGVSLAALLLSACAPPPLGEAEQARRLAAALSAAADDPDEAVAACLSLPEGPAREDCAWGVAERLGAEDPKRVMGLCRALDGVARDECHFVLARAAQDVSLCAKAGRFAMDCERNVFVFDLEAWLGAPPRPGQLEPQVQAALVRFQVNDLRVALWDQVYTEALTFDGPPTQAACAPVEDEALREICLRVARRLLTGQVERVTNRSRLFCEGPLPNELAAHKDPLVAQLVEEARASGACTPGITPSRQPPKR